MTTPAGHLAAGTCRFRELLAAFDAGDGAYAVAVHATPRPA